VKNHYPGEERRLGEIWFSDGDSEWVHSIFTQNEPDLFFVDCDILYKQSSSLEFVDGSRNIVNAHLDYIVMKKKQ
jgi:hypothetical protein